MKKFLLFVFLFSVSFCSVKAQENAIYKGRLKIKEKAYVSVEEKLKIIVDDETDFPFSRRFKKDNKPISITLTLNDKHIEFALDKEKESFVISSKETLVLNKGSNILSLTYTIPNVMVPGISKDIFEFDLGISGWNLNIKRGTLTFCADATHIIDEAKINFETADGKQSFNISEDEPFILQEFSNYKNASLKIIFEKGFLEQGSFVLYWFGNILYVLLLLAPGLLAFITVIYCYVLWNKYGKDPKGPFVTQYAPPKGVTPAFAMCVLDRDKKKHYDFDYFFITLSHLVMKGYISVTEYQGKVCVTSLKGDDYSELIDEDKLIYKSLFLYSPKLILDGRNITYMYNAISLLIDRLDKKRESFFRHNLWYMTVPAALTFCSVFFDFFAFLFLSDMKIYAIFCFIISLTAFVLFLKFIDNVTPEFQKLYCKIMGFKQYLEIAEQGRIKFSNPFEKERIFCDYLAYAYAFGIGKGLVKMFPAHFSYTLVASLNCMTANRTVMFNVFQSKIYHNERSYLSSGSSLIRTVMRMRRK